MRRKTIAANWKANADLGMSKALLTEILNGSWSDDRDVIIAPPHSHLHHAHSIIKDSSIKLASQDCSCYPPGAYTGEVTAEMLKDLGVEYVILGHSERRQYFNEDNSILKLKIQRATENNLKVIFCVGESLEQREAEKHFDIISGQLEILKSLPQANESNLLIAYEPVWAIGTGKTASSNQAEEVQLFIREYLAKEFTESRAIHSVILYGGSVKPNNAPELFEMRNIDGGLIGGASLVAEDFLSIIRS